MRLATITNWAYGATVVLALGSASTMLLATAAQDKERAAVEQRYLLDQAASDVRAEVMALSDRAREYVITGDRAQMSIYRRNLTELGSIEARLRRLKDRGAGPDELSAIADAMRQADTLQDEQQAAIAQRDKGDADAARRILFGVEYERGLDRVAADVERFEYRLDQRTEGEVRAAASVAKIWKAISETVIAVTGLLFLCVLYFVFKRRVLRPVVKLSDVVSRLAAHDFAAEPPEYDQIDEIGDMAQALRVFRENGLERQRLEEERQADLTIRTLLSRMTQRMQGCETMSALEHVIESFMPQIAPGLAGRLYVLDERRNSLVEAGTWLGPIHSRQEFVPTCCWGLQRGDLHRPHGQTIDIPCTHLDVEGITLDTICLPLVAQRTTLGLLYLEPRQDLVRPAPQVAEIYLRMLAENISLALGNLRLRNALQEMAMADALTGLSNRRHLNTVLESRTAEAGTFNRPISCLMVDVDHFKRFNDTFGHEGGDAVLRAIGDLLKRSTRESDVAFRYGGEEFLLLMPEIASEQAFERAQEIQARIRALTVSHGGRELGPLTASFGLATAPDQCNFGKLVETADAALYRAKATGRDRIVISDARWTDQRNASSGEDRNTNASSIAR
jgi:diguanylate cyclase (GGDEF)-like protein